MNIYDLISRAQKLRQETKLDSVSPDRVGALCEDTLKYINEFQLLASSPSLHKIYASVSAMQADKSPKSDLTGKALKPGQLVVIVPANQSDATAGDVYRYDGPSGNTSAWTFVSKIGAVPADAELNATSANPVQNKVVTEKLTELSAEVGNAFIKQNQAFDYDYNIFYDSRQTDATDILRVGKRLKGKMFFGGPNYPLYGITFFDSDRNIISRYVGDSDTASHREFDIEVPEKAAYFVATNYNEYRNDSYIYVSLYDYIEDIELTKRIPIIEKNIGENLATTIESTAERGVSQGIKCQGKAKVKVSLVSGTTTRKWNVYRYVNGEFNATLLAGSLSFGDEVVIDIPNGDDGIWIYLAAENNIYTIECNISTNLIASIEQHNEEIQQLNDVTAQIEEELQSIQPKVAELDEIKQDVVSITGDLGRQEKKSTKYRIGIWLDDTPIYEKYQIRVLCDNPPIPKFTIYKATPSHGDLVSSIREVSFGTWVTIERDSQKPTLYIYSATESDATIDERDYVIEFRLVSSVVQDVEELKNRETSAESWRGKTIVCFGDSITEFKDYDNNKAYSDYIQDLTEADVINIGIGGTQFRERLSVVETPTTTNEAYAALDIVNMVRACCEQNFTKQINATNYLTQNNIDANDAIIARMQTIDWSKVDVVTIFGGTNDWNNASTSWGAEDSNEDKYTFGAINEIVRMIMTTYPHVHVYWFTPIVRWLTNDAGERTEETFSDNFKRNETTLREFSARIQEVVKKHHLPVCDMYNTLGWNMYNFFEFFSDTDTTHPRKGKGTEQIARKMIAFINANKTF